MANIKFSAFTELAPIDQGINGSYIVGYEGDANTNNRWTFGEVAIGLKAVTATPYSIYSASGTLEATREVTFSAHDLKFIATGNGKLWYQDGNQAAGYVLKSNGDGEASWGAETDTTYNVFTGADGSNPGTTGLVPQPTATDNVKFLTGAATWATPTDTTYLAMTDSALGLGKLRYAIGSTPSAEAQSTTASRTYGITANSSNQLIVNVPWTDTSGISFSGSTANGVATYSSATTANVSANLTFATDTLTVQDNIVIKGDGSSDASKLKFNCYNNNHYVEIIGPDHAGSPVSYSIKLPNALPNVANQILESNASGALSWIATPTDTNTNIANTNLNLDASRTLGLGANQNLTFTGSGTSKVTFSNLGGVEIARDLTVQRNVIIQGQGYSELNAMTANTFAPDWNIGNVQSVTLTQASTFAPTNPKAGATYILIVTNTNAAITWGSYIKWAAPDTQAAPPELSGSGKTDVITLICYDTTNGLYYGSITKDLS